MDRNLIGKNALLTIKRMERQEPMTFQVKILAIRKEFGNVEVQVGAVRGKNWVRLDGLEILD